MPCALQRRRRSARAAGATRMVYCAQTEVAPSAHARDRGDVGERRRHSARRRGRAPRSRRGRSSASRSAPRPGWCRSGRSCRCACSRICRGPRRGRAGCAAISASSSSSVKHGAAVAVAAERLGREEAGARSRRPSVPSRAAAVGRAEALRGVVDHEQALGLARPRAMRGVVGGLAEQVDRDHRLGRRARALRAAAIAALELCGIEVEGRSVDVDEHRRRAQPAPRPRRWRRR